MKMIDGGTSPINQFAKYSYNCNLGRCKRAYLAPLPSFTDLQLYVRFGTLKPVTYTFTVINLCSQVQTTVVTADCKIIAHNGDYWYGVFKGFTPTVDYPMFIVALAVVFDDDSTRTFFSEQYDQSNSCATLTKVSVCYPDNYNAEDMNGIYIGEPSEDEEIIGGTLVRYQHAFWIRDTEIIETQNKITFTSNATKNFASKLNRIYEFRTELVPGWYKDYLLSVYFRGQFAINGTNTKASDLACENILEEADLWKPWAKIDKEDKGSFGCAPITCADDCCIPIEAEDYEIPTPEAEVEFNYTITLTGTSPYEIAASSIPEWMTAVIVGNELQLSGIPDISGMPDISITVINSCGSVDITAEECLPIGGGFILLINGIEGQPYYYELEFTGTPPFILSSVVKPSWMTVSTSGNVVILEGTPDAEGEITVSFTLNNCFGVPQNFEGTAGINPFDPEDVTFHVQNNAFSGSITAVNPTFYIQYFGGDFPVTPGAPEVEGYNGGYDGPINVTVSGAVFGNTLKLRKNGAVVDSVNLTGAGIYTLNASGLISFTPTDDMLITMES